jgi:hypothetical protein
MTNILALNGCLLFMANILTLNPLSWQGGLG